MVQAVLFDLGDTLYCVSGGDPKLALTQGIGLAFDYLRGLDFSLPPRDRYVRRVLRRMTLSHLWSRWTLREIQLVDLIRRFHRRLEIALTVAMAQQYARCCHEPLRRIYKPAPEAKATLQRLCESGYRLGLVSNTFMLPQVLDEILAEAGLLDFFEVQVYSCVVGRMKPHRRIFEVALQGVGASAKQTLFVGDRMDTDIKGAKRMGMRTALLLRHGRVQPGRYQPDHIIRTLAEVVDLLPGRRA